MKKFIFVQSCGIFKNDVLVAVNCTHKDIVKFAEKHAFSYIVEGLKKRKKDIEQGILTKGGFVILDEDLAYSGLLFLKDFSTTWESIEILLHELRHLVYIVSSQKGFENELEAQAYLFTDLFDQIRRKLNAELIKRKGQEKKKKTKRKKHA